MPFYFKNDDVSVANNMDPAQTATHGADCSAFKLSSIKVKLIFRLIGNWSRQYQQKIFSVPFSA